MAAIIVVSSERYSGKSSLVVGLALELRDRGFSVGYMKPVGAYPIKVDNRKVDEDAYFVREALGLDGDLSDISPYFLTWDNLTRYMRKTPDNAQARVEASYKKLADGKDVMFLEGAQNFLHGRILNLSAVEVANLLDAKVLLLDTFNEELSVDRILSANDYFGKNFLGAVINWVPPRRIEFTRNLLARYMGHKGINVFGSIPQDRLLRSITVNDLAHSLNGKIICAQDRGDELIESMMVGAMGQDQALRLFRKQANKVVVTGGDRSDIQLAALETPTKSLILTGGHRPSPLVLGQAEEIGVPVIMVDYDTATTVEMVEAAIGHQKVHSPRKIERIRTFIRDGLDLDLLLEQLSLHIFR
ncbi:MAG: phosphotransacetylase family protein [Candidatus Geothermincolia bacterium]